MTTESQIQRAEEAIRRLLAQGADPRRFRGGIAEVAGMTDLGDVDAIIMRTGGVPSTDSRETIAQDRLAEDRRLRRERPAQYRAHDHEED